MRVVIRGLLVLALSAATVRADLPVLDVDRLEEVKTGTTSGPRAIAWAGARKLLLKSNRPGQALKMRTGNFEAELLAHDVLHRVDLPTPRVRLVRLGRAPAELSALGPVCLEMEHLELESPPGRELTGGWPGSHQADVDAFLRMYVVDLLIGNVDRHGGNFFVKRERGRLVPVPIDNNLAFVTLIPSAKDTGFVNFLPTFDGPDRGGFSLGSVSYITYGTALYQNMLAEPEVARRVPGVMRRVLALLDDDFIDRAVEALPPEVLPPDALVDPATFPREIASLLLPGESRPLQGAPLFAARKAELKRILEWRRDHLAAAWKSRPPPPADD